MNKHYTDYRAYQAALKRLTRDGFPKAMAATINTTAKAAHNRSLRNVRERFTLRNRYTERSIRFSEARVKSGGRVGYAVTGSKSPYLPTQETGGMIRARKRRIAIPTKQARVGGKKSGVVRRKYWMSRMGRLGKGGRFFILWPAGGRLKKPGIFTREGKRLIFVRDLSSTGYRLQPTRWHGEAVGKFAKRQLMNAIFIREARKQLGMIR